MKSLFPHIELLGTGSYLPRHKKTSETIDIHIGKEKGTTRKLSQIHNRYWVDDKDVSSEISAHAAKEALQNAHMQPEQLSCIIAASAFPQQPLPSTAAFIQERLGLADSGIPVYDVNSSCLSHLTALDQVAPHISMNRYEHVLIVSSDMPSRGLNKNQAHSYVLFGDGAGASIFGYNNKKEGILCSHFETYSSHARASEVRGGMTLIPGVTHNEENHEDFLFDMDGKALLTKTLTTIPGFLERMFEKTSYSIKDVDVIIPHQASYQGLQVIERFFEKNLNIGKEKIVNIVAEYGNMVAASLPFTLDYAVKNNRIHKGQNILMIGTAAGLTIGGTLFEY